MQESIWEELGEITGAVDNTNYAYAVIFEPVNNHILTHRPNQEFIRMVGEWKPKRRGSGQLLTRGFQLLQQAFGGDRIIFANVLGNFE
jgi:hypothetical protein